MFCTKALVFVTLVTLTTAQDRFQLAATGGNPLVPTPTPCTGPNCAYVKPGPRGFDGPTGGQGSTGTTGPAGPDATSSACPNETLNGATSVVVSNGQNCGTQSLINFRVFSPPNITVGSLLPNASTNVFGAMALKSLPTLISATGVLYWDATGGTGAVFTGPVPFSNVYQVAVKKYWPANLNMYEFGKISVTQSSTTLPLTFDGSNVWALGAKIDVQSRSIVSTTKFDFLSDNRASVFDGVNVFVADCENHVVHKVLASTGQIVANCSFVSQLCPICTATSQSMAYDGSKIWVLCGSANNLQAFSPSNCAISSALQPVTTPSALALDGRGNLWVTDVATTANTVTLVNTATATIGATYPVITTGSPGCLSMINAGLNMFIGCFDVGTLASSIVKIFAVNGAQPPNSPMVLPSSLVNTMCYDGQTVWGIGQITNSGSIWRINANTFVLQHEYLVSGTSLRSCAFDGTNIWVSDPSTFNVTSF